MDQLGFRTIRDAMHELGGAQVSPQPRNGERIQFVRVTPIEEITPEDVLNRLGEYGLMVGSRPIFTDQGSLPLFEVSGFLTDSKSVILDDTREHFRG